MTGESKDPNLVALSLLEREVREIKRELQGDPDRHYEGLWQRLITVERGLRELNEAWEESLTERRIDKTYRRAFLAGLGALGLLSGVTLWVVYAVLQAIVGAGGAGG